MTVTIDHTDTGPEIDSGGGAGRVARRPPVPDAPSEHPPRRRRPGVHGWITIAIGFLATTAYTWNLWNAGTANGYYAAAVKSASVSWKAWFFGALDPGSFITVDKPPFALWVMGLSARIFGYSTMSMLLPEAAAGVASVLILHHLVRRWRGDVAAHLAALAFTLTPVAALMFRFNNPDAILALLGLGATWALWKALETGRTRMLLLAAALTGLAFNTKMLQAFLIVPAFVLVYAIAGPPKFGKRFLQLCGALGVLVVSSAWWAVIVWLWPASARPYIGSTTNNSIWSLVAGYNGLNRVLGSGTGASGGRGGGAGSSGFGGTPGVLRLFNGEIGGQIAWLIPFAIAGLGAGLWLSRRGRRTDRDRAGWMLWGTWFLTCAAIFSLSKGIFHAYYTVQLAPAVAALAGAGAVALWELGRRHRWFVWVLPAAIAATAWVSVLLLNRTPHYAPWLTTAIVLGAALAIGALIVGRLLHETRATIAGGALAVLTLLAGPAAYTASTVAHPSTGSIVLAGPSSGSSAGFGGGGGLGIGIGGGATSSDAALVKYLEAHQGSAKYLVAAFGSQTTASIILESGKAVITIGGFSGSDPAPTLAQFETLVAEGKVRYVLVSGQGGGFGGPGGNGGSSTISSWVTTHGTAVSASLYGGSTNGGTLYRVSTGS